MQSEAIGIPLIQVKTSWEDYEENFKKAVMELEGKGVEGGVFGDVDLEEHREWIEGICTELGIKSILPLWGIKPEKFLEEFFKSGFKAKIVATRLEEDLLGRDLNEASLQRIRDLGSHPCGEHGEYHTFVINGPLFKKPLKIIQERKEKRENVWFLDISVEIEEG